MFYFYSRQKQSCFVYLLVPVEEPLSLLVIFATVFVFFSQLSKITANFLGKSHGCERLNYENEAIPIHVLDFQSMTHELVISKHKVT